MSSLVFRIDKKLLQHRPPRLTLAGTLVTLGRHIQSKDLEASFVVDILNENRLLPYMLGSGKSILDISLGRNTSASKIGDLVVSEECIKGTYELTIAFLEFILTALQEPTFRDTTKSVLASVIYIANEIYPSHHIWSYKNIESMNRILSLCTAIFHHVISNLKGTSDFSELEAVCIISLSQNQAHKQLLDVIVEGKSTIKKQVESLEKVSEEALAVNEPVVCVRRSLFIFNKLLSCSDYIKLHCDLQSSQVHMNGLSTNYKQETSAQTTNIERALFDTNITPSLLQHLFSYIYQKDDSTTACLAVDLIKNVATKFSMSLMANLGSEADKACEFFVELFKNKDANTNLEAAIIELLSTCVKHQPGLIELFLNYKQESKEDAAAAADNKETFRVVMDLFIDCRSRTEESHKLLHTLIMKFILTFWQKQHSAVEQFDMVDGFWDSITFSLLEFLRTKPESATPELKQSKTGRLHSYALMILAREIFYLNSGIADRKMNPNLKKALDELSEKNFLGKYSNYLKKTYSSSVLPETSNGASRKNAGKLITSWRDFLVSFVKYKPFEVNPDVQKQIINDILGCMTTEVKLEKDLDKERILATGDTLLLICNRWIPKEPQDDHIFEIMHELLYLVDTNKDYLPFSFLLTFLTTLNLYLARFKGFLSTSKNSFDLLAPTIQLMQFGLKVMEKHLNKHSGVIVSEYKSAVESRLFLASIMATKFIADFSRRDASLWIPYLQTNFILDMLVQFFDHLMSKRVEPEICLSIVELLLCLSSIKEAAEFLNKAALVSQINTIALSTYDKPFVHLSQLAPATSIVSTTLAGTATSTASAVASNTTATMKNPSTMMMIMNHSIQPPASHLSSVLRTNVTAGIQADQRHDKPMYKPELVQQLEDINSNQKWLPVHLHIVRLNVSMYTTLNKANELKLKALMTNYSDLKSALVGLSNRR